MVCVFKLGRPSLLIPSDTLGSAQLSSCGRFPTTAEAPTRSSPWLLGDFKGTQNLNSSVGSHPPFRCMAFQHLGRFEVNHDHRSLDTHHIRFRWFQTEDIVFHPLSAIGHPPSWGAVLYLPVSDSPIVGLLQSIQLSIHLDHCWEQRRSSAGPPWLAWRNPNTSAKRFLAPKTSRILGHE